jgi:DNA-binding winged helix-turn-helix (wHTH) protein
LRAKLGPEHESLIGTVRNVGYKFVSQQVVALPEVGETPGSADVTVVPQRTAVTVD